MVKLRTGKTTTLSDTRFKLKIEIGATALCIMYIWDIYNTDNDMIRSTVPDVISPTLQHISIRLGKAGLLQGNPIS
jgi:hypothetical protein